MRLLLDENLPKRLKLDFQEYEIHTVRDQGWNGVKNGELLRLLLENGSMHVSLLIKTCNTNRIS